MLHGAARFARSLVYVPNSGSNTVDVIDPTTYKIVEHFTVGGLPQHVVPAYDLKTLYVTNDRPHEVLGYVVFTYTFHLWGSKPK